MIKVCFLQSEWDNKKVLDTYKKMTPGRSGKWKDMIAVTSIDEADFCVIIDYTIHTVPPEKAIYIGAHPTSCTGYVCFDDKPAFAKLDLKNTPGFGEWWLNIDYDTACTLQPTLKSKNICCIISNQRLFDYHRKRIEFLNTYCDKYTNSINVYGRIIPTSTEKAISNNLHGPLGSTPKDVSYDSTYWYGKETVLEQHRYALEFDMGASPEMGICENYFSERFIDDMIMWCMPIYYGGTNIHKYLPENSFKYVDIFKDNSEYIYNIVNSDFREIHLNDMAEARDLLLNKYQLWPRIYNIVKGC